MALNTESLTALGAPLIGALFGLLPQQPALPWWRYCISSVAGLGVGVLLALLIAPLLFNWVYAADPKHWLTESFLLMLTLLAPLLVWGLVGLAAVQVGALLQPAP